MSNPTELPDLEAEKANFEAWAGVKYRNVDTYTVLDHDRGWQAWCERARRAQSNGKGSQVDALYKQYWAQWPPASSDQHAQSGPVAWVYECRQPGDDKDNWAEFFSRNKPNDEPYIRNTRPLYAPAATLSPLCGAQHDEDVTDILRKMEADPKWRLASYSLSAKFSALKAEIRCAALAAQQAAAPGALLEILRDVHDTLESQADSDIDHFEDDEEEREGAPVQYAARRVMQVIQLIERAAQLDGGQEGSESNG